MDGSRIGTPASAQWADGDTQTRRRDPGHRQDQWLDATSSKAELGTGTFWRLPLPSARQGVVGVDSVGLADLRQATEYHEGRYHELAVDRE